MSCERCGREAPTKRLAFHQHVGLLVFFLHSRHASEMCRICGDALLRRTTIVTSLAGWWGVFSFFLTPITLLLNLSSYFSLRSLPYPGPDAEPVSHSADPRELRFGITAVLMCLWTFFWPAGDVFFFARVGAVPLIALAVLAVFGAMDVIVTPIVGLHVLSRARRVAHDAPGRLRLQMLAIASLVRVGSTVAANGLLAYVMWQGDAAFLPYGSEVNPIDVVQSYFPSESWFIAFIVAGVVALVAGIFQLGTAISAWWLVPRRIRQVITAVADTLIFIHFVIVTLLFPIQPSEEAPETTLPAIRLAITTVFAARVLARLVPFILDLFEMIGFRLLVAARMLRARKTGFLTLIGGLSILAVTVSTCMLTLTLSIMGGFRNDLKTKLLGNNAHVVVDRERGTIEDWEPTLERVRRTDEVVAASPFVTGDVMITSSTNLSAAVLRGIDPRAIGRVTDLPRNMRHGSLSYLEHPERLLRLRADEMSRGLRALPSEVEEEHLESPTPLPPPEEREGEENPRGSLFNDIEEAAGEDPDIERIEQDLDEFLLEDQTPTISPFAPPEEEEVLPGVIVGQELAHTLRLHVGDEVDIVSPFGDLGPSGPMPRTRPFRVAGIFYSGMYEFDMTVAYVTLEDGQRFLNVGDGIHGIEAKLEDAERAEPVARAIASQIRRRDVRVRAWQEVNRTLFGALQLEKVVMFSVLGMAILVASFCVIGSLTLMVQEKAREVGILKAMGASGEQVVAVFMAQGLMIGLLGAVMGLGLGYVQCFVVEHFGIALNPEVYYIDRLPVFIDPGEFVSVGIAAVVICLLATIYPALLGSRLRPVDALRDA